MSGVSVVITIAMKLNFKMKRLGNKGSVAIILCLLMTALLGIAAYVIDIGLIYSEKAKMVNAIDASALAAVIELPNDAAKARKVAIDYLVKNNIDPNKTTITIGSDNKSIQIFSENNVKHFFAPVIGINSSNVLVNTKAVIGPLKSVSSGLKPFAVEAYDFSYGTEVTLKEGGGEGYNGNYGAVALGGNGANVFKANALYGYNGKVSVGDYIDTEPGNMAGATNAIANFINGENSTFDNFQRDSIRLWTIPIVDTLQVNGRKAVQVIGFGEFYVEAIIKNSGKTEINGRFIRYVTNGDFDVNLKDTGIYSAKLSN